MKKDSGQTTGVVVVLVVVVVVVVVVVESPWRVKRGSSGENKLREGRDEEKQIKEKKKRR